MSIKHQPGNLVVEAHPRDVALQSPLDIDIIQMFDALHVKVDDVTFRDFSLVSVHSPDGDIVDGAMYGKWSERSAEIEATRHPIDEEDAEDAEEPECEPYPIGPLHGVPYSKLYKNPYTEDPDEADYPEYPVEESVPDSPDDFEEDYYEDPPEPEPVPEFHPVRPWIDVPMDALSVEPGLHVYEVLWENDVTHDLKYQAFCYRVLDSDPDKSYIYMRKQERQ